MIDGRGPSPSLCLLLIQRLPDDSLTAALQQGGREFFGWGQDRHLRADIYDALNLNTRASGNWGKSKAPKIPAFPRPEKARKKRSPRELLSELHARLTGRRST